MQVVLNFPESEAAHVLAFLNRHPAIQLTPTGGPTKAGRASKARAMDETQYLTSTPANTRALNEAIERTRQGRVVEHDLIEP